MLGLIGSARGEAKASLSASYNADGDLKLHLHGFSKLKLHTQQFISFTFELRTALNFTFSIQLTASPSALRIICSCMRAYVCNCIIRVGWRYSSRITTRGPGGKKRRKIKSGRVRARAIVRLEESKGNKIGRAFKRTVFSRSLGKLADGERVQWCTPESEKSRERQIFTPEKQQERE
eukprot:6214448-Pleurochrysis_carterae.AAC.1